MDTTTSCPRRSKIHRVSLHMCQEARMKECMLLKFKHSCGRMDWRRETDYQILAQYLRQTLGLKEFCGAISPWKSWYCQIRQYQLNAICHMLSTPNCSTWQKVFQPGQSCSTRPWLRRFHREQYRCLTSQYCNITVNTDQFRRLTTHVRSLILWPWLEDDLGTRFTGKIDHLQLNSVAYSVRLRTN